jgi:CDP-glucose 4,6-dehydratase
MRNSFWHTRPVFVTGATGFVGSHIVDRLVAGGARVVCLQRDVVRYSSLDILGLRDKVSVVHGDLEDFALLERILNEYEVETVFHLAAQALVTAANRSPLSTFETNIRGSYLLLEACRLSPTVNRIVVASSDKAYGSHSALPYYEDFALQGRFPYDVSKACADLIAQSFAASYDLPVTISRSSNAYGSADLNLSRIIPGTIISILQNEHPVIRSDGTPVREFIHIDDVVRGYLTMAERIDVTRGQAYNFGTSEPIQMLELVEKITRLMGKERELPPRILLNTKIEREIDAQYLSGQRIFAALGWKAEITLDEGLRRTIDWYRENFGSII